MKLDNVQIQHFRNLVNISLRPSFGVNIFIGENGSGKTSLLEALHYLSYGRSFRTTKFQSLIADTQDKFVLFSSLIDDADIISSETPDGQRKDKTKVGISRSRDGVVDIRLDGEKQNRVSSLALKVPTQTFTPQSSDVLIGPPGSRRSYLDWGLFHVEPSFLKQINLYNRVLKQRNASLKQHQSVQQDEYWCHQLETVGENISELRMAYIETIKPYFRQQIEKFLPEFCIELAYYRGWEKGLNLEQALAKHQEKDRLYGHTSVGPHKADLKLRIDSRPVQEILSRGQLRMLMAAMQIAQSKLLLDKRGFNCIYLLDDVAAELDVNMRDLFIQQLLESKAQIFVTATEKQQVAFLDSVSNIKMFHVEQGQVNEEKTING